jgi:hypothetical protein
MTTTKMKIKEISDYSKLSVLSMNRCIDSKHVQKMIKSIRKMGIIRPVVITTTNIFEGLLKTYIIDGQHLATALERENLPIPCIEIEITSEEDLIEKMAYLNNSSKSWDLMNYINAWKMIRPDYMKLFKWKNMYDIEVSMLAAIGINSYTMKSNTQTIKTGDFVITNPNAELMCKQFNDIFIKIGTADRYIKFNFLHAFLQVGSSYDHEKVLANIDKHMKSIRLISDSTETGNYIRKQIFGINKK